MSKRADSPYRSGRSKDWLKIKCGKRDEFVIGGYSRSDAPRTAPFSSLLLGTFEDGELVFAGKVGTGFRQRRFRPARPNASSRSSASTRPSRRCRAIERQDAVWLEPKLVCEIAYHRMDAGRTACAIRAFRACARTSLRARCSASDETTRRRMACAKSVAATAKGRSHVRRHHALQSRQGALSRSRPDQARPRPLLRGGRALHAALRRQPADQPRALPGRHATRSASSSATP